MAEVNKKPNIFVRMGTGLSRWFREMKSELKKVQWPTAKQTVNNVIIVIICVIVVGVCIWIFDAVAMLAVKSLLGVFAG